MRFLRVRSHTHNIGHIEAAVATSAKSSVKVHFRADEAVSLFFIAKMQLTNLLNLFLHHHHHQKSIISFVLHRCCLFFDPKFMKNMRDETVALVWHFSMFTHSHTLTISLFVFRVIFGYTFPNKYITKIYFWLEILTIFIYLLYM